MSVQQGNLRLLMQLISKDPNGINTCDEVLLCACGTSLPNLYFNSGYSLYSGFSLSPSPHGKFIFYFFFIQTSLGRLYCTRPVPVVKWI